MNHCRLVTISSGRLPFSQNFTGWSIGRGLAHQLAGLAQQFDDAVLCLLHGLARRSRRSAGAPSGTSSPGGGSVDDAPVASRRSCAPAGPSSRHQITSVVSPNVQIMAMPEPFSGSASSWATTGTSTLKSGVRHLGAEAAAGSARRRGGRRRRRRRRAARAAWSRCKRVPSAREHEPVVARRRSRGPRARPGRPRSSCRRPTAWVPRPGRRWPRARSCEEPVLRDAPGLVPIVVYVMRPVDRQAERRPQARGTSPRAAR